MFQIIDPAQHARKNRKTKMTCRTCRLTKCIGKCHFEPVAASVPQVAKKVS